MRTGKIVASILFGIFSAFYLISGLAVLVGLHSPLGLLFILASLVAVGAIIGIYKENKFLLALGLFLALIQILDGGTSIMNKYIFGDDISVTSHIIIALAYIYPVIVISKTLRKLSHDKAK